MAFGNEIEYKFSFTVSTLFSWKLFCRISTKNVIVFFFLNQKQNRKTNSWFQKFTPILKMVIFKVRKMKLKNILFHKLQNHCAVSKIISSHNHVSFFSLFLANQPKKLWSFENSLSQKIKRSKGWNFISRYRFTKSAKKVSRCI